MALKYKVATALRSDPGRARPNNEDAIAEDADTGLLVLADGMGGYNAGEIASGIAVATVRDAVRRGTATIEQDTAQTDSGFSPQTELLRRAMEEAHAAILDKSRSGPEFAGMGTTIVACLVHEDRLSIGYVGDSRLYRLRGGQLQQITRDHSLVEELIARGHYNREDAERLVRRNIVTRALGIEDKVDIELMEEPLQPGDLLLLCSDGLTDMADHQTIALTLREFADNLPQAAENLIKIANDQGGRDNISVVLARIDGAVAKDRNWLARFKEWL
jgi:protein phosphatase